MDNGHNAAHAGSAQTPKPQQSNQSSQHSSRDPSPVLKRDTNSQSRTVRKQSSNTIISLPPSISASPQTSRNTSPIRPSVRPQETPRSGQQKSVGLRSSKDSGEPSPARPAPLSTSTTAGPPSAAAIQRALSATSIPQLQSGASENTARPARGSRTAPASEAVTPISPAFSERLKSPGPSAPSSRRNSLHLKKADYSNTPGIVVQASTPPPSAVDLTKVDSTSETQVLPLQPPKSSNRGPSGPKSSLETVQEATPPSGSVLADSTDHSFHSMNSSQTTAKSSDSDRVLASSSATSRSEDDGRNHAKESEAEAKPKTEVGKAKAPLIKSAAPATRTKQVDTVRNMTVETETVSSIPQSALTADRSSSQRDPGGSLRLKPSNETIRPRKERKRVPRKAPSIHNGTASSKADIFEARVASAVDEVNSSDSDETFVYESNPPEPQLRSNRHHSRTPSVTSNHSQSDRRALRAYDNHRVAGKRSMKFSNNSYNIPDSPTDGDTGTIRAHHPRNISRFGRTIGSNSSLYDPENQHVQAAKLRQSLATSHRQSSRPNSPNVPKFGGPASRALNPWGRKFDGHGGGGYDFDGEGADDERAPLIGTVRTSRNRQNRRYNSGRYDNIYNIQQGTFLGRFGGCMLVSTVLVLLLLGAGSFLFLTSKSLYDVEIRQIQNVLASEQEIMLDMVVGAINPNVLGMTITDMDINLFAKSKHLVTSTSSSAMPSATAAPQRRSRILSNPPSERKPTVPGTPWQDPDGHWHDGDDNDGNDKDGLDSQTMLLGRVFHFDQGLYFDGSPLRHTPHVSIGEFRLPKPGNKTEAGGSERWERVLQFPFELILRGVLRYTLPVSGRAESAAVRGSVIVHPEGGVDEEGRMRLSKPEPWRGPTIGLDHHEPITIMID